MIHNLFNDEQIYCEMYSRNRRFYMRFASKKIYFQKDFYIFFTAIQFFMVDSMDYIWIPFGPFVELHVCSLKSLDAEYSILGPG